MRLATLELYGGNTSFAWQEYAVRKEVKLRVAGILGNSERHASRLLLALTAFAEVQDAAERGEISVVNAGKVAHLPPEEQEQIVAEIRRGERPRNAVRAQLKPKKTSRASGRAFRKHIEGIAAALDELDRAPADSLASAAKVCGIEGLERARRLLDRLIGRVRDESDAHVYIGDTDTARK